jgi:outer membrane receptor protein involved in Fe transport
VEGWATNFPGPGDPTLNSGAQTQSFENRLKVINAGMFVQGMVALKDRYFLTLGMRVDGNSAFGESFGLQPYPKASLSYVISDENFWPEVLGTVKLRAAYGHAGRAPGAFDAVRTWNPVGWAGDPAFKPLNVGNPDLGPERTAETEVGFDAALLDQRLSLDFTYYYQQTTNALFNVRQIPSLGFLGSQLKNVGKLENQGFEVALNAAMIKRQSLEWDLGVNVSGNRNMVLDLGGVAAFSLGSFGWIVEGQPVPVIRARKITNPDEKADAIVEQEAYYGPNSPTLTVGPHTTLRLPAGIQLSARGEYQGGNFIADAASLNALNRAVDWPTCANARQLIASGQQQELTAKERMQCIPANVIGDWFIYPADFFKLRDITLKVPVRFAIPGTSSATLSLSALNVWTWKNKNFPVFDPEVGGDRGSLSVVRSITEHVPPPALYKMSLRVVF